MNNLKFVSVPGILARTKDVGGTKRYQVDIIGVTFLGSIPGVHPALQGLYSDIFVTSQTRPTHLKASAPTPKGKRKAGFNFEDKTPTKKANS